MARRYRNQFLPRTQSRPNRAWASAVHTDFQAVAAGSKVLLGSFSLSNTNIDETALRVVGGISIVSDQLSSAESQIGAFGMIVVSDTAAAAGVASIPGPVTDGGDDGWFVYQSFARQIQNASSVGVMPNFAEWYPIDSKARRIVAEGQVIAMVVENASATHGFSIARALRLLSQVRGTR